MVAQRLAFSSPVQMTSALLPPMLPPANPCFAPLVEPGALLLFQRLPALGGEGLYVWFGPSSQARSPNEANEAAAARMRIDLRMEAPKCVRLLGTGPEGGQ